MYPTSEPGVFVVGIIRFTKSPLLLSAKKVTSDVENGAENGFVSKACKPGKVISADVTVPLVTSTVSVPEKLVPVRGGCGIAGPETSNVVIVSALATPTVSSSDASIMPWSAIRFKDKGNEFCILPPFSEMLL